MPTRPKTKTEDGLVHAVLEPAIRRSSGYFTLCSVWTEAILADDAPVTCFSCLEFLASVEFLEDQITKALQQHVGAPVTKEVFEKAVKVIENWATHPRRL